MIKTIAMCAGLVCTTTVAASAGDRVYRYDSAANYCPAGLQPVTISGVICCGKPNAGSYQQAMMHPVSHARKRHKHVITHSHVKRHSHVTYHSHGGTSHSH